jgi:hypothetical protein
MRRIQLIFRVVVDCEVAAAHRREVGAYGFIVVKFVEAESADVAEEVAIDSVIKQMQERGYSDSIIGGSSISIDGIDKVLKNETFPDVQKSFVYYGEL